MPELPEVEVVRRSLQSFINGLKIKKVTIFNRNLRYKIKRNFERIIEHQKIIFCLLYTSPSPRDRTRSRMPSSA